MMAIRALSTTISGVDSYYHNADDLCFVNNKLLQLMKRPATMSGSVRSPYRCPTADIFEIFQCYTITGVFGAAYQSFSNSMVYLFAKFCFFFNDLFQSALGVLAATLLQVA